MHVALYRAQRICLGLLLGTTGLYAGVLLMYSIGIAPVLDAMTASDFLKLWQYHDFYFHIRIRFLLAAIGVFYGLTLLLLLRVARSKTFVLIALSFLLSVADVEVNRALQRPVSRAIRLSDEGRYANADVYAMERHLFHALHLRQLCSISAFGLLCIAAMLPHSSPARRQPQQVG